MSNLDKRLHPYREDLAAMHLRDKIEAENYVVGRRFQVNCGSAPLRRLPDKKAVLDTELLFGETVILYDEDKGWAWVQSEIDGYVGYTERSGLNSEPLQSTHSVTVLASHIYPEPDLKTVPIYSLPMTARVTVNDKTNNYYKLASGGWIFAGHLEPIHIHAVDHCEIARMFLNIPYLWGGKTSVGIDCSGLLQVSLARCGKLIPRDSDMQISSGQSVLYTSDEKDLRRGDLVFWPGHAGILLESQTIIHANATEMRVTMAPLDDLVAKIEESTGDKIIAVRRV